MVEINLTTKELLEGLTSNKGLVTIDHYRRIIELDDRYFMALYYKDYVEDKNLSESIINEKLNYNKKFWDGVYLKNYGMTALRRKEELISKIEEVQEEYADYVGEDTTQVISGLLVCQDYPVGVILPKRILEYKPLFTIEEEGTELTREDINRMFDGVRWWVDKLIEKDVYTDYLYIGNILVSPNDYSHVVLDRLDDDFTCRIEPKEYVRELAKRGKDLVQIAYDNVEDFKDSYHRDIDNNHHYI